PYVPPDPSNLDLSGHAHDTANKMLPDEWIALQVLSRAVLHTGIRHKCVKITRPSGAPILGFPVVKPDGVDGAEGAEVYLPPRVWGAADAGDRAIGSVSIHGLCAGIPPVARFGGLKERQIDVARRAHPRTCRREGRRCYHHQPENRLS